MMGDMSDWTTDNGLIPEDEWVVSARDNEYEREIRTLRKENERLRADVALYDQYLLKACIDIEELEAEVKRLRDLLGQIIDDGLDEYWVTLPGSKDLLAQAESVMRGKGDK